MRRMKQMREKGRALNPIRGHASAVQFLQTRRQRDRADVPPERIILASGIDNEQTPQTQIGRRLGHRPRSFGGVRIFEFETDALASAHKKQIEFSAAMGAPEGRLRVLCHGEDLLNTKAFPRRAALGMAAHLLEILQPQQRVQDAGIPQIHFWMADEPLAEILIPRRQDPYHESMGENVEMPPRRLGAQPERAPEFRSIPNAPVVMRKHSPKTADGLGRSPHAELAEIALQKGAHECLPPRKTVAVRLRQKRQGKSAAVPQIVLRGRPRVLKLKPLYIDEFHPPREGLRSPGHQLRACASKDDKLRRKWFPIRQHAQEPEQIRPELDLIQHDQAAQRLQCLARRTQPRAVTVIFEVIPMHLPATARQLPRRSCLPRLPRTQQRDHTAPPKGLADRRQKPLSFF